eukprot:4357049-Amphidinium_carterae.1
MVAGFDRVWRVWSIGSTGRMVHIFKGCATAPRVLLMNGQLTHACSSNSSIVRLERYFRLMGSVAHLAEDQPMQLQRAQTESLERCRVLASSDVVFGLVNPLVPHRSPPPNKTSGGSSVWAGHLHCSVRPHQILHPGSVQAFRAGHSHEKARRTLQDKHMRAFMEDLEEPVRPDNPKLYRCAGCARVYQAGSNDTR